MANVFKVGDRVKTIPNKTSPYIRTNGVVKYVACALALKSKGSLCDKKKCNHIQKDFVWVIWPGAGVSFSYHYNDLEFDAPAGIAATTPNQCSTPEEPKKEPTKAYVNEVKAAINHVVQEKKSDKQEEQNFFRLYNGMTKMGYDKRGRPVVQEAFEVKEPIKETDIDWAAYNGFTSGPTKKSKP